jgi:hypothetical protein
MNLNLVNFMAINDLKNSTLAPLGTFRTGVVNVKIPVFI